jgi:small subunit ribosomal protein S2
MRRFIFGERSGIYIIDLEKTLDGLSRAYEFLVDIGRRNGIVLFVGTKKQAQETITEQATRVGMPYVISRWVGGLLTNFQTVNSRLKRLKELREMERGGAFEFLPKKEVLKLRHEKDKLERNYAGIQDIDRRPDAIFVLDTKREHIAVKEARKLGIPVVAIVDTNCDPDEVDYIIPGNDDAIRACSLITKVVADAIQEGQYLAYQGMQARGAEPEFEEEAPPALEPADEEVDRRPVQLSAEEQAFFGQSLEDAEAEATKTAEVESGDQAEIESETQPSETGATDADSVEEEFDHGPEAEGATSEASALLPKQEVPVGKARPPSDEEVSQE